MSNTYEKVRSVLSERLGVEINTITPETRFKEDLSADSLEIVELMMELEDAFNVEISDEHAEQLTTVASVVQYIDNQG